MIKMLTALSSWRTLVVLLVAYVVVFIALISGADATADVLILDLRFNYDVATVYHVLTGLGEAGRADYRTNALTLDILYPIIYSLTFSVVLTLLIDTEKLRSKLRLWVIAPFGIALADLVENLCIAKLVSDYPKHNEVVATLVSWATPVKWSIAVLVLASIVMLGIYRLVIRQNSACSHSRNR